MTLHDVSRIGAWCLFAIFLFSGIVILLGSLLPFLILGEPNPRQAYLSIVLLAAALGMNAAQRKFGLT